MGGGPPNELLATIKAGGNISDIQNICGQLVGIGLPALWDAAAITFQGSFGGTVFRDVWDNPLGTGVERTMVSGNNPTAATRYYAFSLNDWLGINFLKVRSGTSASPVNQTADRVIRLLIAG